MDTEIKKSVSQADCHTFPLTDSHGRFFYPLGLVLSLKLLKQLLVWHLIPCSLLLLTRLGFFFFFFSFSSLSCRAPWLLKANVGKATQLFNVKADDMETERKEGDGDDERRGERRTECGGGGEKMKFGMNIEKK